MKLTPVPLKLPIFKTTTANSKSSSSAKLTTIVQVSPTPSDLGAGTSYSESEGGMHSCIIIMLLQSFLTLYYQLGEHKLWLTWPYIPPSPMYTWNMAKYAVLAHTITHT